VLTRKEGHARDLAEQTWGLLRLAVQLWAEYHWRSGGELDQWVSEVRFALSYHLRDRPFKDQDNQKLLRMLRRYHQRRELLRFLEQPEVEPSTNRVERALRPAVIARKVSQCSKNKAGAYAFSAFKSVVQTLVKQGVGSVVEAPYALFRFSKAPLLLAKPQRPAANQIRGSLWCERLSGALLDRVTHHCHVLEFNRDSYRFKESLRAQEAQI
jgi:hypothetical protein